MPISIFDPNTFINALTGDVKPSEAPQTIVEETNGGFHLMEFHLPSSGGTIIIIIIGILIAFCLRKLICCSCCPKRSSRPRARSRPSSTRTSDTNAIEMQNLTSDRSSNQQQQHALSSDQPIQHTNWLGRLKPTRPAPALPTSTTAATDLTPAPTFTPATISATVEPTKSNLTPVPSTGFPFLQV